jgi:hypothetical protein
MTLSILHGDVFSAAADVLIIALDGAQQGLRSNMAHGFIRRWPRAYEDLEAEVRFPLRLGTGQLVRAVNDSPFPAVLFVSTLHHLDTFTDEQKLGVVRAAFTHALDLAHDAHLKNVATTVLKGGWRLDVKRAFGAMQNVYPGTRFSRNGGRLVVHTHDATEFATLIGSRL